MRIQNMIIKSSISMECRAIQTLWNKGSQRLQKQDMIHNGNSVVQKLWRPELAKHYDVTTLRKHKMILTMELRNSKQEKTKTLTRSGRGAVDCSSSAPGTFSALSTSIFFTC